jgi:hypothetical protein
MRDLRFRVLALDQAYRDLPESVQIEAVRPVAVAFRSNLERLESQFQFPIMVACYAALAGSQKPENRLGAYGFRPGGGWSYSGGAVNLGLAKIGHLEGYAPDQVEAGLESV